MNNIGIIGQGYVGSALKSVFKEYFKLYTFDKFHKSKSNCNSIDSLSRNCDMIFVCVPTPMKKDGSCFIGIIEDVLSEIDVLKKNIIVVIKSTVPPGTTEKLSKKFSNLELVFNPEFLTEANYLEDFKNQNRIILGGESQSVSLVKEVYQRIFPNIPYLMMNSKEAEFIKYFINCYLATKVTYANEMKHLCDNLNLDYDRILDFACYDDRLGKSHWQVPGPDGELGFGGHCLPKDLSAIISQFNTLGLLDSVNKVNLKIRNNKDWEKMDGRAVIDD